MTAFSPPAPAPSSAGDAGHLSQWQLIRRRFARHKLAVVSMCLLVLLYGVAGVAEVVAPAGPGVRRLDFGYCPPQPVCWSWQHGLHARAVQRFVDPVTLRRTYVEYADKIVPLGFFVRGDAYRFWGLIPTDWHLFGVDHARTFGREQKAAGVAAVADGEATIPAANATPASAADAAAPLAAAADGTVADSAAVFFLLGSDQYGRDIFSRILYGSRISLSVGLIGISITFLLGMVVGGVSGYVGGRIDSFIQRVIEVVNSFPQLPLWIALGAIMPADWSPIRVYFAITVVLSLLGWTGLARVVRGKILSLREEDYAVAARLLGASHTRVLFRHLVPGFASHVIVALSLSVPVMILGETSLSFLGLGLRPPVVSWGVLLQDCLDVQAVRYYPWLLTPVLFIVATVLSFNFVGDGLRDAADPYATA